MGGDGSTASESIPPFNAQMANPAVTNNDLTSGGAEDHADDAGLDRGDPPLSPPTMGGGGEEHPDGEPQGDAPFTDESCEGMFNFPLYTMEDTIEVMLLKFLQEFGGPETAYDTILDWAHYTGRQGYPFGKSNNTRKKRKAFMKRLTTRLRMDALKPCVRKVILARQKEGVEEKTANIAVFNFSSLAKHMFADSEIMRPCNLVYNLPESSKDPYGMYVSPDGDRLGEILSGDWYRKAYRECINLNAYPPEFLCSVVFYNDATVIDGMQRFSLDLFRWTFAFFKRRCRFLHFYWKTLGYISGVHAQSLAQNKNDGTLVRCSCLLSLPLSINVCSTANITSIFLLFC